MLIYEWPYESKVPGQGILILKNKNYKFMEKSLERCMGRDPPHRKESHLYEYSNIYDYKVWMAGSLLPA